MADLKLQFDNITAGIELAVRQRLDIGLDKAADRLMDELEKNSPSDPHSKGKKYKFSWMVNRKYKNIRYVGNTKTVKGTKGEDIPLSNILEYDENKGHFIRNTYDSLESELINIVLDELSK